MGSEEIETGHINAFFIKFGYKGERKKWNPNGRGSESKGLVLF